MADISSFISQIKSATRGETVRDAIVKSIEFMDKYGISANKLATDGSVPSYTKDDLVTKKEGQTAVITGKLRNYTKLFDSKLDGKSNKAIKCSVAYKIYEPINKKLDDLLGVDN